jgi:hypothetical protein
LFNQGVTPRTNYMDWGSCKVEVGENFGALTSVGTLQNVSVKESWKEIRFKTGNGGEINPIVFDQEVEVSADLNENDLAIINIIRGGIDTYAAVAGTPVSGASQVIASGAWAYKKFIKIENQNYNGGAITVNSVTAGTDGVLVADTDYYVGQNENGDYGIYVIDSLTVTTLNQTLTINHDYTPAASKTLSSGGKYEIAYKVIRLTNTHPINGTTYQLDIYKASNTAPLEEAWQDDGSEKPNTQKFTMRGVCDTTRTAGDQLYKITRQEAS